MSFDAFSRLLDSHDHVTLCGVPDGLEGRVLAALAARKDPVLFVARDMRRLAMAERSLAFFAPAVSTLVFPAWDCLPYDRVSPSADITARRMSALHALAGPGTLSIVFTTANAVVQRVLDRATVLDRIWSARPGSVVAMDRLVVWLERNGFERTPTVREVGEYAVRGGIVDLYA